MKQLIKTNVASTNIVELWHLSSKVEGEVRTNYGEEHEVEGDDEREDNDSNVHDEASSNPDILIQHFHGLDSIILSKLDCLHSTLNGILEEDE
jgi:hypothetical protein